ncbi:MAG: hypothetical protein AVDCRST_MAG30-4036, partial [uncultured Solirubrobacteraceae bacterium]
VGCSGRSRSTVATMSPSHRRWSGAALRRQPSIRPGDDV